MFDLISFEKDHYLSFLSPLEEEGFSKHHEFTKYYKKSLVLCGKNNNSEMISNYVLLICSGDASFSGVMTSNNNIRITLVKGEIGQQKVREHVNVNFIDYFETKLTI